MYSYTLSACVDSSMQSGRCARNTKSGCGGAALRCGGAGRGVYHEQYSFRNPFFIFSSHSTHYHRLVMLFPLPHYHCHYYCHRRGSYSFCLYDATLGWSVVANSGKSLARSAGKYERRTFIPARLTFVSVHTSSMCFTFGWFSDSFRVLRVRMVRGSLDYCFFYLRLGHSRVLLVMMAKSLLIMPCRQKSTQSWPHLALLYYSQLPLPHQTRQT